MSDAFADITCENCVAACCKAPIFMQLTAKEYTRHRGTMDFKVIKNPLVYPQRVELPDVRPEPIRVQAGYGLYLLASGCANLTEANRCSVYEDRPGCCRAYELHSPACIGARRKAGLDADRVWSEEELAALAAPDPARRLVQEFFPGHVDEPDAAGPEPAKVAPPVGLFDLRRLSLTVEREASWIREQLSAAETWSRRTRCAGWSIGDLAAHVVTGLQMADAVFRAAIDGHEATTPPEFHGDRTATLQALGAAADAVSVSLDHMKPSALTRDVVLDEDGVVAAQYLVEVLVMELSVHGLDLAAAVGQTRHLAPEAVGAIARVLPDLLDAGPAPRPGAAYVLRSSAFEMPFTWHQGGWSQRAAPDPCTIDGDPEAVLLYALGRMPFDKSQLATNRADVARTFKRYLVGP